VQIIVNNYSCIWVLAILYTKLLHKCEFGWAHCVGLFKRVHTKFTLQFLDIPPSFYKFWKFKLFFGNFIYSFSEFWKRKIVSGLWAGIWPKVIVCWLGPAVDSSGPAHASRRGAARVAWSPRPRGARWRTHRQLTSGPRTACWTPWASSKGGQPTGQSDEKRGALGRWVDKRR
jgi:hypothetical protein